MQLVAYMEYKLWCARLDEPYFSYAVWLDAARRSGLSSDMPGYWID